MPLCRGHHPRRSPTIASARLRASIRGPVPPDRDRRAVKVRGRQLCCIRRIDRADACQATGDLFEEPVKRAGFIRLSFRLPLVVVGTAHQGSALSTAPSTCQAIWRSGLSSAIDFVEPASFGPTTFWVRSLENGHAPRESARPQSLQKTLVCRCQPPKQICRFRVFPVTRGYCNAPSSAACTEAI